MADKKISALTAASTPLAGTEVLPIVQNGATVKVSVADLTAGRNLASGKIDVTYADATYAAGITVTNTSNTIASQAKVYAVNNAGDYFSLGRNSVALGSPSVLFSTGAFPIDVYVNSTLSTSFTSAGNLSLATGNLVIGTSGKGIDFSATPGTGTSELLADYEEGTWTPIDSSGAGLSLTVNSATYTKIGRVVTAFAYVVYPSTVSGATVTIGGLPFTTRGSNGGFQPFPVATDASIGIYGYTAQNATTATFYNNSTNAVITNASISTKYLLIAITYTT